MHITKNALEEFKNILCNSKDNMSGIRIFTQQGCCGPRINMSLAEKSINDDKVILIDSVTFYIENSAEKMLSDVTIDHVENGFILKGLENKGGCC